jgi:hypothetical protein
MAVCPTCKGSGQVPDQSYTPPPDWEDAAYLARYPDVEKAAAR